MRTKRYATPTDPRRRNGEVQTIKPDPRLWKEAVREAGDPKLCRVLADGTIIIRNAR